MSAINATVYYLDENALHSLAFVTHEQSPSAYDRKSAIPVTVSWTIDHPRFIVFLLKLTVVMSFRLKFRIFNHNFQSYEFINLTETSTESADRIPSCLNLMSDINNPILIYYWLIRNIKGYRLDKQ